MFDSAYAYCLQFLSLSQGDEVKLLPEATELLGELRLGIGLGHGAREAVEEDGKVSREDEAVGGGGTGSRRARSRCGGI
ncbi:uncharacterized protein G2W53_004958 [Senna tora]|uniref:Uncharacterized protein n=1 Tax=Senna tora TaxID=362788 RepID=A0A834XDY2_9FABA|nr:uncharacterized protein G2W53_004958 [Senna tora]